MRLMAHPKTHENVGCFRERRRLAASPLESIPRLFLTPAGGTPALPIFSKQSLSAPGDARKWIDDLNYCISGFHRFNGERETGNGKRYFRNSPSCALWRTRWRMKMMVISGSAGVSPASPLESIPRLFLIPAGGTPALPVFSKQSTINRPRFQGWQRTLNIGDSTIRFREARGAVHE
jgi:hypothetical protein